MVANVSVAVIPESATEETATGRPFRRTSKSPGAGSDVPSSSSLKVSVTFPSADTATTAAPNAKVPPGASRRTARTSVESSQSWSSGMSVALNRASSSSSDVMSTPTQYTIGSRPSYSTSRPMPRPGGRPGVVRIEIVE